MTEEPITRSFTDTAKRIARKPDSEDYDVIFRRHAAFYSVDGKNTAAVTALTRSAQNSLQVKVLCNALTSAIVEASIIE